jgi:hypothetical protein
VKLPHAAPTRYRPTSRTALSHLAKPGLAMCEPRRSASPVGSSPHGLLANRFLSQMHFTETSIPAADVPLRTLCSERVLSVYSTLVSRLRPERPSCVLVLVGRREAVRARLRHGRVHIAFEHQRVTQRREQRPRHWMLQPCSHL